MLGSDGRLYGTTAAGNDDGCGAQGCGTVFKVTPSGVLTTLFSFCGKSTCANHGFQPMAGLVQGTDGNFYGTTYAGGTNHNGTIFKITPTGNLTTRYSFCAQANCADGAYPLGALVQGTDGYFYGTTWLGGFKNSNTCSSSGCGTVFKITPGGELTTFHDFCSEANCADGAASAYGPNLIQASDGNFYGTSTATIFKITPQGVLTTLYSTPNSANGLVQATDGNFYGTITHGGVYNWGTVFSLSAGLGPFVESTPTSGKVGAKVVILGTDLTGATDVMFNGAAATFTVVSASEIRATVPTGATTGTVKVTTPRRTLSSNVEFRVQ